MSRQENFAQSGQAAKSGDTSLFSWGLVLLTSIMMLGTAAWSFSEKMTHSAWRLHVVYELDGRQKVEHFPYEGLNSAIDALQIVEARGGSVVGISSDNDEMGLVNPDIDVEHIREVIRRQSL